MERGFFASLFDVSFTSFITTKIIKLLYVLALIGIGLTALLFVVGAFHESTGLGVLTLCILAPLAALIYTIYTRVLLEFVVQVFRISELLRDQNQLQRAAFANAGWLDGAASATAALVPTPAAATRAVLVPAAPPTSEAACPNCGVATTAGAKFCRHCGHELS